MKVSCILNGRPVENWKRFTIRGKAKRDYELGEWIYQLNTNGKKYKGDEYFPEKALKALESAEP